MLFQLKIERVPEQQQIEVSVALKRLCLQEADCIVLHAINTFGEVLSKHKVHVVLRKKGVSLSKN